MKNLLRLSIALLVAGTSCSSGIRTASTSANDDLYYSSKDAPEPAPARPAAPRYNTSTVTPVEQQTVDMNTSGQNNNPAPASSEAYAQNNTNYDDNYSSDDYYDYEYAARLKRFHNPSGNFGYYDDPYTNSYYYSNDPWMYGSSIYMGYNFWGPSYNMYMYSPAYMWGYTPGFYNPWCAYPHYGFGIGFGYGMGFGYNPWYMGGGYGYGYGGYGVGNYNSYYANTYDHNSVYYGPRASANSTGRGAVPNNSFAHRTLSASANNGLYNHSVSTGFNGTTGRSNTPVNPSGGPRTANAGPRSSADVYSKNNTTHYESKPVFENRESMSNSTRSENIRSNNNVPSSRNNGGAGYGGGRNNANSGSYPSSPRSGEGRNNSNYNNGGGYNTQPSHSVPPQHYSAPSNGGGNRSGGGGFRMGGGSSGGSGGGGSHSSGGGGGGHSGGGGHGGRR
jgi:hypothetical protein